MGPHPLELLESSRQIGLKKMATKSVTRAWGVNRLVGESHIATRSRGLGSIRLVDANPISIPSGQVKVGGNTYPALTSFVSG